MAVKIRLKRMGKIRAPFYRVVIMDSRTKRDGRAIEEIGKYHPTEEPSLIDINSDRAQHWLAQGAQPTEAVEALLKITGDWQRFKGLPGVEGTLRVAEPKTSKKALYEAAVTAAGKGSGEDTSGATTPRKKAAPKKVEVTATEAATLVGAPATQEVAAVPAGAALPLEDGSAPEGYTVKGNADSGKYHQPGGQWYDATVAEFWFKSEADAQAAGFVKAGS